jgi:hypothetical protein
MSEESRLGRESIEVAYALKAFVQAGVRVFLYLATRKCPRRSNGRTLRGIWKVVRDDLTVDRRGDSGGRWDSRGLPRASIYATYSPPGEFTGPPAVASNGDWMASHLRHSDSVHRARFPGELSMIAAIYARKERPRSEENP